MFQHCARIPFCTYLIWMHGWIHWRSLFLIYKIEWSWWSFLYIVNWNIRRTFSIIFFKIKFTTCHAKYVDILQLAFHTNQLLLGVLNESIVNKQRLHIIYSELTSKLHLWNFPLKKTENFFLYVWIGTEPNFNWIYICNDDDDDF